MTECTAEGPDGSCDAPVVFEMVGASNIRRGACEAHLLPCLMSTMDDTRALNPQRPTLVVIDRREC